MVAGSLMAYCQGVRLPAGGDWVRELWAFQQDEALEERAYTLRLGGGDLLYLPPSLGRDPSLYCATLGHKVNHSFRPNCRYHHLPPLPLDQVVDTHQGCKKLEALESLLLLRERVQ